MLRQSVTLKDGTHTSDIAIRDLNIWVYIIQELLLVDLAKTQHIYVTMKDLIRFLHIYINFDQHR